MSEFINTVDVLGDDAVTDSIITRTIEEYADDRITTVGEYAFYGCSNLKAVDLPNVTHIKQYAFYNLDNLVSLNIPNATNISSNAFEGCDGLTELILRNIKSLNNYTFQYCKNLEFVEIGSGISHWSVTGLFYGCSNLKLVVMRQTYYGNCPNALNFAGTKIASGTGYILMPSTIIEAHKTGTYWSTWASQYLPLEEYTVDGTITGELDMDKIGGLFA